MENENVIRKTVRDFSKQVDIIQTIIIYLVALLVPTFLGEVLKSIFPATSVVVTNTQLIVGSIVNSALIMAALNLKGWAKILGVITMPSISTILSGYVFTTASTLMVYMIPAIWAGNFALVYAYKYIKLNKNMNYIFATVVGIVIKVGVIFGFFSILKACNVFPAKMVGNIQTAMSTTQLITASIGSVIAYGIYVLEKKK